MSGPAHAPDNLEPVSVRLHKLHGAGNDFLVTVIGSGRAPDAELARAVCDRHTGVGADGLIAESQGHFDPAEYRRQLEGGEKPQQAQSFW